MLLHLVCLFLPCFFANLSLSSKVNICNECEEPCSRFMAASKSPQLIVHSSSGRSQYISGKNYSIHVKSVDTAGFIFAFRTLDILYSHPVEIYVNNVLQKSFSGQKKLMDKMSRQYVLVVDSTSFALKWITDPPGSHHKREIIDGKGFEVTITAFRHDWYCSSDEFDCRRSQKLTCIKKSLTCNGRNNCGNLCDEKSCKTLNVIFPVALSIVGVMVFVASVIVVARRWRKVLDNRLTVPSQLQSSHSSPATIQALRNEMARREELENKAYDGPYLYDSPPSYEEIMRMQHNTQTSHAPR